MVPIGKNYFYHEGKVYKEVKPQGNRWKLVTKQGKRQWISKEQIQKLISAKCSTKPSR